MRGKPTNRPNPHAVVSYVYRYLLYNNKRNERVPATSCVLINPGSHRDPCSYPRGCAEAPQDRRRFRRRNSSRWCGRGASRHPQPCSSIWPPPSVSRSIGAASSAEIVPFGLGSCSTRAVLLYPSPARFYRSSPRSCRSI